MVFRRDHKGGEAFQRQISALRQQLGGESGDQEFDDGEQPPQESAYGYSPGNYEPEDQPYRGGYRSDYPYEDQPAVESFESPVATVPVADAHMTVISNDTTWKGEVSSEGSMHIHGQYDGVIKAREDVYILEEAVVAAEVHARNVVVAGRYNGAVSCETRFEVLPSGRVQGSVRAPVLIVHDGAEINGSIQMTTSETVRPAPASLVSRRASASSESRS